MSTIKRLNELSEELYGEFGFATLNEDQMDLVLQYYIDLDNMNKMFGNTHNYKLNTNSYR